MLAARKEFEAIISKTRICTALSRKLPTAPHFHFAPNQPVYVYREKEKRWTGPHLVRSVDGKSVHVDLGERSRARQFNLSQVKHAKLPSIRSLLEPHTTDSSAHPTQHPFQLYTQQNGPLTFFTEILRAKDSRSRMFDKKKQKELLSLIKCSTFRVVLRSEAGLKPNIIPTRFVLALKHKNGGSVVYKARFFVAGHRDRHSGKVVHNATTLKQSSLRLLIVLASILGFDMYSIDVDQKYLQPASKLRRKIFIKPDIIDLGPDELLQLVKPIYGLTKSRVYWNETLRLHHVKNLNMSATAGDHFLLFKRVANRLVGLSGSYVDDILRAGTPSFLKESYSSTSSRFQTKPAEATPFDFTGLRVMVTKTLVIPPTNDIYISTTTS